MTNFTIQLLSIIVKILTINNTPILRGIKNSELTNSPISPDTDNTIFQNTNSLVFSDTNIPINPFIPSMIDFSLIEKLFDDSNPLELVLVGFYLVFVGNFFLLYFLTNILIFKYLNSHRTYVIKHLDRLIPILTKDQKSIDKLKNIILKIMDYNSKVSTFWIVFIMLILLISHITSLHYLPIFIKYFIFIKNI